MINTYIIRDGKGGTTESSLPEVAELIHAGKLKFTGKKEKWNKQEAQFSIVRYYVRVNRPPVSSEQCSKPCCNYTFKD